MKNPLFKTLMAKAANWKGRNARLVQIVSRLGVKLSDARPDLTAVREQLATVHRMLRAYTTRRYTLIPWKSAAIAIAGVVYFLDPFDLIPDFIAVGGLVDDVTVLMWVFSNLKGELDKFASWEKTRMISQ